jgi:O-antigen/teichoic acid export membrane protein
MSPLIVVGGRQALGLVLTCTSLAVQIAVILLLVPQMGIIGVGWGYLGIELTLGVIPVSILGMWATGIRLNWSRPIAIIACAAGSALFVSVTPIDGSFSGGILAGLLFAALVSIGALFDRQGRLDLAAAVARNAAGR